MNKNLGLFALLVTLLAAAFYFEEIRKPNEGSREIAKKRLLKKDFKFSKISLQNAILVKTDEWRVLDLDFPASGKKIKLLSNILIELQILEKLPQKMAQDVFLKTKIPFTLTSSNRDFKITLGDVSEISGNFYLAVDEQVYVVQDNTAYTDVYSSELDLKLKKYLRFKSLLTASSNFYIENNLFDKSLDSKLKFAKIDSRRNRWYTIDIKSNTLTPAPYVGVRLKNLEATLKYYLLQVQIKKIVETKQNVLTNLVSEVAIGTQNQTIIAKLFMGLNGNYGRFVRLSSSERVFEIEEEGSDLFFQPDQSFWLKQFVLPEDVYAESSFSFALSSDREKYYLFKVEDVETFKISNLDAKIKSFDKNLMNFTFNLLLNATVFKEASYITKLEPTSTFFSDTYVLTVKLFKKLFHVKIEGSKIEVLDQTLGLVYHFSDQNDQVTAEAYQRIFTPSDN